MYDAQIKLINEKRRLSWGYISDLYWDYDRLSSSGQETLDKLAKLHGVKFEEEVKEETVPVTKKKYKSIGSQWKYAVWVGGVDDYFIDYESAKRHHDYWVDKGHDDVKIEVLSHGEVT
jgi:hypothetical protein